MPSATSKKQDLEGAGEFFAWRPSAWLRVSGADAGTFLQGQFSNDLRSLSTGRGVYGLWLNHKGRVLADSFVLRANGAEEFWIGSYFSPAAVIRERLEAYVIADDVVIEDVTGNWSGMTRFAATSARAPEVAVERGAITFAGRRGVEPSIEDVFPDGRAEGVRAGWESGAKEVSADEMERRRIRAGIPAVPVDIGPGELPNEGGLENVAISYVKGCYLGQEVMARLKSMGQVRRRLLRVRGSGAVVSLPAALFQGERKVGELRSAVNDADGFIGLALISLIHFNAEFALSFSPKSDGEVRVFDVP